MNDHELAVLLADAAGKRLLALRAETEVPHGDEAAAKQLAKLGDAQANDFLLEQLKLHRPDDAVLSEEAADSDARLGAERVWIIDPIDGTNEFAEPPRYDWAIHIALWEKGKLTVGSVALPTLGITFDADPAPIVPPSTRERPLLVTSRTRNPYCAVKVANALGCDVARLGSAGAKAMAVVMGEADIYVHDGGMYQWDSAAPSAVAAAAGLHVSRTDGSPLIYNEESLWLPDFLVCRPEFAEAALRALND